MRMEKNHSTLAVGDEYCIVARNLPCLCEGNQESIRVAEEIAEERGGAWIFAEDGPEDAGISIDPGVEADVRAEYIGSCESGTCPSCGYEGEEEDCPSCS